MAERRKSRRKKEDIKDDECKPSKIEYSIAKYLRDKLPVKKTTLLSHKVEYFIASKAIDCLLDSPWAKSKKDHVFTNRESVVEQLDLMLRHKFFHRARKIVVQKEAKKKKDSKEDEESVNEEEKPLKKKDKKNEKEDTKDSKKEESSNGEKKKEKKKIKLDMHLEQLFVDGNEAFVWIYDPIPVKAWVIGTLLVIGAVLICLFPLWPKTVRHYVYYLSVAAAGFLVLIIALAVLRLVVFVLVWVFSLGNHHLWLLPNLTEDVGFFESFWPLYKYKYKGNNTRDEPPKKKKKSIDESSSSTTVVQNEEEEEQKKDTNAGEQSGGSEQDTKEEPQPSEESDHGSEKNSQESFEILDPCDELRDEGSQPESKEDEDKKIK